MQLKQQSGQAIMIAVLALGMVMAGMIFFGANRQQSMAVSVGRMDSGQAAYEALAAAAKRVQVMYASESGCDPETLETRIDAMSQLPTNPGSLGLTYKSAGTMSYVIGQPGASSTQDREGRCTGGTGCRQLAIPLDNYVYIVTVGAISRTSDTRTGDCPRDASVKLSTVANRNYYVQNVTLTNLCTISACDTGGRGFVTTPATLTLSGSLSTVACTGANANIPIRKYGGGFTTATSTALSVNDLRWARRYLETGGADIGETNFLYTTDGVITGNGSCTPALSAGQCLNRNCFPALDLNRDKTNNEADLAILENFMRGYINSLPANELP